MVDTVLPSGEPSCGAERDECPSSMPDLQLSAQRLEMLSIKVISFVLQSLLALHNR